MRLVQEVMYLGKFLLVGLDLLGSVSISQHHPAVAMLHTITWIGVPRAANEHWRRTEVGGRTQHKGVSLASHPLHLVRSGMGEWEEGTTEKCT